MRLLIGVTKLVTTCAFSMVCLWEWGLGEVSERAKISKIGQYTTSFMGLRGFCGGCVEGVCLFQRAKIENLWS